EVAIKYRTTSQHVSNMLRWAEKENFFQKAQDAIDNRLIPKSIDLLERTLEAALRKALDGDTDQWEIAEKILKGVALLSGGKPERVAPSTAFKPNSEEGFNEYSFERYVERYSARKAGDSQGPDSG